MTCLQLDRRSQSYLVVFSEFKWVDSCTPLYDTISHLAVTHTFNERAHIAMTDTYLHIGSPKTGSSALQAFFLRNRDALLAKGIDYPDHWTDENMIASGNGQQLGRALRSEDYVEAAKIAEGLRSDQPKLLLSSEFFFRLSEPGIRQLRDFFPRAKIIVYVRRQGENLMANYVQGIKRHGTTNTIDQLQIQRNFKCHWYCVVESYVSVFGADKVILRVYEQSQFEGGSIESDFLQCLGVGSVDEFSSAKKRINTSYPRHLLEYKRLLNVIGLPGNPFDPVLQHLSDNGACPFDWPYPLLSPTTMHAIDEKCVDCNASTARRFLNRDDGRLFIEPLPTSDQDWKDFPGLTAEEILVITEAMVSHSPQTGYLLRKAIPRLLKCSEESKRQVAKQFEPVLSLESVMHASRPRNDTPFYKRPEKFLRRLKSRLLSKHKR